MSANIEYINYVRIQWLWLLCQHVMIMVIMSAYNNYWYYVCTQWLYKLCLLTMITDIMSAHNDYIYYVRIQWLWTFCLHVNCQFYKNINICILYYLVQPVGSLFKRMENWFLSAHLNSVSLYITFITFSKYRPQG